MRSVSRGLVLGLIGGGLAADVWRQQEKKSLMAQLQQEQLATAGAERARMDEIQSKLARAEKELTQLRAQVVAERDLRHRYEDLVAKRRK